eukprot:gene19692-23556_t
MSPTERLRQARTNVSSDSPSAPAPYFPEASAAHPPAQQEMATRQQPKHIPLRDIATEEQQAHEELGRRVKQLASQMALGLSPSKLSPGTQEGASQEHLSRAWEQPGLRGQPATESPSENAAAQQSVEFHMNFQRAMAERLAVQQMLDSTRVCAETLEGPRAATTDTAASVHCKEAGQPLPGGGSKWGSDGRGVWLGVTPAVGPAQIESLKHLERQHERWLEEDEIIGCGEARILAPGMLKGTEGTGTWEWQLVHAGDGLIESRRQLKE